MKNLYALLLSSLVFTLLSCASQNVSEKDFQNTAQAQNKISPTNLWLEQEDVSQFLPLSKVYIKENSPLKAQWVQIKFSQGEEPDLDSLIKPIANHLNTKFTLLENTSNKSLNWLNYDGTYFKASGRLEDQDYFIEAFLFLTESEYQVFIISGPDNSNLKNELSSLISDLLPNPSIYRPKPYAMDDVKNMGLELSLGENWKSLDLSNLVFPSQRFAYLNQKNQCVYTLTGSTQLNKSLSKDQILNAYLTTLGTSLAEKEMEFKRGTNGPFTVFKILAPSYLKDHFSQIVVSISDDYTYMNSIHCENENDLNSADEIKISSLSTAPVDDEINKKQEAFILNQVGLVELVENRNLVALSYFDIAQKLDPSNPDYLANCAFVYQSKGLHGPGIIHFRNRLELVKKNGHLLKILGEFYEGLKEFSNAYAANKAAFEYLPFDEELAINLSDVLWGMGRKSESYRAVNELYTFQKSHRLGLYLAKTLLGLEFYQNGATLLSELREKYPLDKETAKYSMIAYLYLQEYEDALAMAQMLEQKESLDLELLILKGKAEFYLKRFKDALTTFKKAKTFQDNNEEVQSFLAATKSFLGIGDSKILSRPIKANFALNNTFEQVNRKFAHSLLPETYPAIMHFRQEKLEFNQDKPWTITEELVIEILDEKGLSAFQEFNFSFIPGYDRIFINNLSIYDSTQTLKSNGNPATYYVSSEYGANATTDVQLAHIPLRDLAVGDFIHLQWSRQSVDKSSFAPFMHHMFNRTIPTGIDRLILSGELEKIQTEVYGEISEASPNKTLVYELVNPSIIRKELYSPHYRDIGSGVLISHKRDWTSVGVEYEKLIKHQFKNSIDVQERAYSIRGNLAKTEEIIEAQIQWVRDHITYDHIVFGDRTIIPSPAQVTLKNRKGDCKDQSLLLKELLGTLNIPSELTLIHLSTPVSPALPSLQQFDHMILHIPAGKNNKERYVDLTENGGSNRIISYHLENKYALIINGDSSKLVITPVVENSNEHNAYFEHTVALGQDGSLNLKDSLVLSGKFGVAFRDKLWNLNDKEKLELLEDWLSHDLPEVNVQKVETINLEKYDQPLILKVYYQLPHLFFREENTWVGEFPNIWERAFMNLPRMRKRHHPIRLPHEMHFTSVVNWINNKNQELNIEVDPINPDRYFTELKQKVQKESDRTILTSEWVTYATYTEAEEYEKLREEWQEVIDCTLFKVKINE